MVVGHDVRFGSALNLAWSAGNHSWGLPELLGFPEALEQREASIHAGHDCQFHRSLRRAQRTTWQGVANVPRIFHEWYWRERDVTACGLVGVGAYSGVAQHARYETYDREVDLDDLHMTPHPSRTVGSQNGAWYGDILIPANTAYLLLSERSLATMATFLGNHSMANRRAARYARGAEAMRKHMWSTEQGCFLAVHRATLTQFETPTVGGFMPLMAQVPATGQAAIMASTLKRAAWATPLPIPTVASTNPNFVSSEFWRGDVWPAPNYQVAQGLASYGLRAEAARIADLIVANALKVGISERYDSQSGAPLGVRGLGMSASVITMMLDGLTSRHKLRLTPGSTASQ